MRTALAARVSTLTRSITSANTSHPGFVPFCLKLPFEWKRSLGMLTPIREPGEGTTDTENKVMEFYFWGTHYKTVPLCLL